MTGEESATPTRPATGRVDDWAYCDGTKWMYSWTKYTTWFVWFIQQHLPNYQCLQGLTDCDHRAWVGLVGIVNSNLEGFPHIFYDHSTLLKSNISYAQKDLPWGPGQPDCDFLTGCKIVTCAFMQENHKYYDCECESSCPETYAALCVYDGRSVDSSSSSPMIVLTQ